MSPWPTGSRGPGPGCGRKPPSSGETGGLDAPLSPDALVRPWRTATFVASLVAAVELIVLIVLAVILFAKPIAHTVRHHAVASVTKPAAKKTAVVAHKKKVSLAIHHTRAQLGVIVLNGNGRTGAAGNAAGSLTGLGYHVRATANARRQDYATSVVMYKNGFAGEGARLGRDLHIRVVGPLDGMKPSALHGAQLVVVLGAK